MKGGRSARDTNQTASTLQVSIYRKLTGSQRLAIACDMSQLVRALALARLRSQHPDWSEIELKRELLRYAFLPDPLPPPLR
jgi:hypothetical protein